MGVQTKHHGAEKNAMGRVDTGMAKIKHDPGSSV